MTRSCSGSCGHFEANARPVEVLKQEHRLIERGLDALERALEEKSLDAPFMRKAVDFFRGFADVCHHAKEEDQLFPVLEELGMPKENGPIGCMLHEHEMGRAMVRDMSAGLDRLASGDAAAEEDVRRTAAQYIDLLRRHIQKEDNVLFMMADQMMDDRRQADLRTAFDGVEQSKEHVGRHERYAAVADELHRRAFGA